MGQYPFPLPDENARLEKATGKRLGRLWWLDLTLGAVIFFLAQAIGVTYLITYSPRFDFYQQYHGPAVMIGLGHGFVNPILNRAPAIRDFLEGKDLELDLDRLPPVIFTEPLTAFQENHRYAMYLIGAWWRVLGVSWYALATLQGVLFGFAAIAAYGIFRLGMGRAFAFAAALLILCSPGFLHMLSQVRDFNKAPFILGALAITGWIVKNGHTPLRTLPAAAGLGVLLGIGLGFRQDLLVCVPACAILIFFFMPGGLRRTWWLRPAAVALMIACFAGPAYPIFKAMNKEAADSFHHINQGLVDVFHRNMGLGDAPYSLGYMYRDEYTHNIVSSFAMYEKGYTTQLRAYVSPEYDAMSRAYLVEIYLRHFPADFLTRWLAAPARILDYGGFALDSFAPVDPGNAFLRRSIAFRWQVFGRLAGYGAWLAVAAILLISMRNVRLALAATSAGLFFAGMTSLQFALRHYFHMEPLFWWVLGFFVHQAVAAILWLLRPAHAAQALALVVSPRAWWGAFAKRFAAFAAIALIGGALPYAGCGIYQYIQTGKIYRAYAETPLTPLEVEMQERNYARFIPKGFLDAERLTPTEAAVQVQTGMLVLELEPADHPIPIFFEYSASRSENDFSYYYFLPSRHKMGEAAVRLFFPVYNAPPDYFLKERRFIGFQVPKPYAGRVKNVYKAADFHTLPAMLMLTLPQEWRDAGRFLRRRPDFVPAMARSWLAFRRNLLPNGGFEQWPENAPAPEGASPPLQHSTITRETALVSGGAVAVRQQWLEIDAFADPGESFRVQVDNIQGGCEYDVFVRARNLSNATFYIAAIQTIHPPGEEPQQLVLNTQVCRITPGKGFREFHGNFLAARTLHPTFVRLAVSASPEVQPGDTVIWDDWRVALWGIR